MKLILMMIDPMLYDNFFIKKEKHTFGYKLTIMNILVINVDLDLLWIKFLNYGIEAKTYLTFRQQHGIVKYFKIFKYYISIFKTKKSKYL